MNDFERIDRINSQIKRDLSQIIKEFVGDFIVSVIKVDTAKDLSNSKVYISVLYDEEDLVLRLNNNQTHIRRELAKVLKLKKIPHLKFIHDFEEKDREKIEDLLQ